MSIEDLHDFAKRLHDYRERQRREGFAGSSEETKLISDVVIQAVHEIANLEERISALEGKSRSK